MGVDTGIDQQKMLELGERAEQILSHMALELGWVILYYSIGWVRLGYSVLFYTIPIEFL